MLLHLSPLLPLLLLLLLLPSSACTQTCGNFTAPYPFGFTTDCTIQLQCKDGRPQLAGFTIRTFSDTLLIDIPISCDRPINSLGGLFGANHALTSTNTLLVYNCTRRGFGCSIPTSYLSNMACKSKASYNVTCLNNADGLEFLNNASVINGSGCSLLYSSVVRLNLTAVDSSVLSFEPRVMEVGWWVEGNCEDLCVDQLNCRSLKSPMTGRDSVVCKCAEGLDGDGFRNGTGCRKASSSCTASRFLSGHCRGTTRALLGGIVAGAALMAIIVAACYYVRKRTTFVKVRKSTKRLLSEASCSIPLYPYKEIEKATNNFSDANRLGTGAYGTVYVGTIHNDEQVAIKKLRKTDSIEQVLNEIKLLSSVSHPNLVRILGCCIEKDEQILVYEYMPNGTLSQHLQRERSRGLPWTIRLNIATETAKAIAHLHFSVHPPIYHRDIKSSNILLDHNFNSKLADFGLSKMIVTERSHISTAPQGTPGYLDPQYHQNFHLSDKSDVYSFGVVLVEIITALKVVDFNRGQSEVNLAAMAVNKIGRGCVEEIIDPFLEPHRDAWTLSSIHKVAELAFRCLAFHRDMRPSMMEVADELEQIRVSGWAPSDENLLLSRQSSTCSSMSNCTDKMHVSLKSGRLDYISMREEKKGDSPMSVEDPWFSEQSSPSANSLLGHIAR